MPSFSKLVIHGYRSSVLIVMAGLLASAAAAQDSLSLSVGSAPPGGSVALNLTLNAASGGDPAAIQWTFAYSPTDVNSVAVSAGPAATGANKSISCAAGSGTYTCVASGNSAAAMTSGTIAVATFQLSSAVSSVVPVNVTNTYGALGTGSAVNLSGFGSTVTVLSSAALSTFNCNQPSFVAPGMASCSVGLTGPAPTGGITVGLSSNNNSLSVPSSVVVPPGLATGSFNATASAPVTTGTTAVLTASYNNVSKTVSEQLLAQPQTLPSLSSVACSSDSLTPPAAVSCTVGLTGPAPASGATVALLSNSVNLIVPASVQVAANGTSANFMATASKVGANTVAVVTATYNGASKTVTETLLSPVVSPVAVTSLVCSPQTVNANSSSNCLITLNKIPSAAVTVTLSSNNSAVTVPPSVNFPVGASTGIFVAQTGAPTTIQSATITAATGGSSMTAGLTVNPAPGGTGGGSTSIAYVQSAKYTNDTASSTAQAALGRASTAGNTLVLAVSWGDKDALRMSASDNAGNTYTVATHAFDTRVRQGLAILYALNAKGGATKVTVALGASLQYRRVMVVEYSGVSALDVTSKSTSTATPVANAVTSAVNTTTANGDLIFAAVMDDSGQFGTISPGSGFTIRELSMDTAVEDRIQGAAGPVAATFTFSNSDTYLAQVVAFKAQ
jgi:hypothetical protein